MTEHISVAGETGVGPGVLTLGKARRNVARVIGNESDPTTLGLATDALLMAVGEWNRRHQFDANALVNSNVAVTAGTAEYDLPSSFLHMYSVRLADRPLMFIRRRLYDRVKWDQSEASYTTHYTLFGSGNTGQLVLLPTPSADETMTMRYYAGIMVPSGEEGTFGIPDRFAWGLVYKAKALLLMDKNAEDPRIGVWLRESEMAFRQARADDSEFPDEDLRMVPGVEHRTRSLPETHPYYYMGE